MGLLFLNAFKGLKKKKVQIIGIIFLILLSTGIYTSMNSALDRLEDKYYSYIEEQNVEDFSFVPVIDYSKDITSNHIKTLLEKATTEEKQILNSYNVCTAKKSCNEAIYYQLSQLLNKYGIIEEISNSKIDQIKDKYDFNYAMEYSKIISDDKYITKAIPYNKNKQINKPYLIEGRFPKKDNEVTVLPKFAEANGLEIGDKLKLSDKTYKIVGYAYSPDHIYPMISFNMPIFDEKYNNIVFLRQNAYESLNGIIDDVYIAKFNYETDPKKRMEITISDDEEISTKNPANIIFNENKDKLTISMSSAMRNVRIDMMQLEFNADRKFASYFLYLLLGISVLIIMIIAKKRIDDERLQIGVLKSLGYSSSKIATSYLVYPIVGSLIGGSLGYLLGISLHKVLATFYLNYFNVPLGNFNFNPKYLINSIILPMIFLSILTYLISRFMLRKKPLDLLKEGSNLKVNLLSKISNKLTSKLPFEYRFKYSLASRSIGKLLIVGITSFCTGLLLVLILIGSNLFGSMIDKTFNNFEYKYMVNYSNIMEGTDENNDLVLSTSLNLVNIKDNNNKNKKFDEEDYSITLNGVNQDLNYIKIEDKDKNNLISKLKQDNGIIINENIKEYLEVDVGDTLVFQNGNNELEYKIIGIEEAFLSQSAYIDRTVLAKDLGLNENSYNQKYSKDKKYSKMSNLEEAELKNISNILSIEDLRRNMENQVQTINSSIYIVIIFASVMALIIIAVIANIVVEENKKTISLMKVMGYKNKKISSIVLNIYTPVVVISYLLSIPAMIGILKWIVSLLVGDVKMAIPISISPTMAIIGLLGLLIAYYIAINMSRKTLNKVPLAIALKRE